MPLSTITNGASSATARAAINAAISQLNGASSPIVTPNVIHVTTAGNDTTGDGTMAKPYLTAQKAFDAAVALAQPCVVRFGVGSFGNVTLTNATVPQMTLVGLGSSRSIIGNISGTLAVDTQLHLVGNGYQMVKIGNVVITGVNGATAGTSGRSVTVIFTDLTCANCTFTGGNGANGSAGAAGDESTTGGNGTDGGNGGSIVFTLKESICAGIVITLGSAGTGGSGGNDGGAGAGNTGADGEAGASVIVCESCPMIDLIEQSIIGGEITIKNSKISGISGGFTTANLSCCESTGTVTSQNINANYSKFENLNATTLASTKFCEVTATDSSAAHLACALVVTDIFFPQLP